MGHPAKRHCTDDNQAGDKGSRRDNGDDKNIVFVALIREIPYA
jgi:hypothetical protein